MRSFRRSAFSLVLGQCSLLVKQLSQGSADIAGAARLGCAFSLWGMIGHRLNAEATWAGEAVQDD